MRKSNFFAEEYVAPEVEVLSVSVEAGFSLSTGFDDATEEDYGDF